MPNKYLDILAPAIDPYGLIAQLPSQDRDGGDTSQREGMLMIHSWASNKEKCLPESDLQAIKSRYLSVYNRLRKGCMLGEIRRHDGSDKWYDLHLRMSRDQWIPNAIALGYVGSLRQKLSMICGMALRGFLFTTNLYNNGTDPGPKKIPDVTALSSWGIILRWLPIWTVLPWIPLCILDLALLYGSYSLNKSYPTNPGDGNSLNQVNLLLQARYRFPTPASWLARKLLPLQSVLNDFDIYFGNGGPPMNVIARDFLEKSWK